MNKKHVLFLGFVVLLMAAIFVFSGCENDSSDSEDPVFKLPDTDPTLHVNDPALQVNTNWKDTQANIQRFTLYYSLNLGKFDARRTSYLWYKVEKRTGADVEVLDYCDPSIIDVIQGGQSVPQTGASVNKTTSGDATTGKPSWAQSIAAPAKPDGTASTGAIIPGIRGLMLYAVCPYFYITKENLTVEQVGKKLTFRFTHNAGSSLVFTDENGDFNLKSCTRSMPTGVSTCPDKPYGPDWGPGGADATVAADSEVLFIKTGDPSWDEIKKYLPYEGYRPNCIADAYILPAAQQKGGGRFNKANLNWPVIENAMAAPTGANNDTYEYIGKLTANYENKILTIKGDLVLKLKQ